MTRGWTLIDTHAHLQLSAFDVDREAVLRRAERAGVEAVVNIGIDAASSLAAVRLAEEHSICWAAVGLHPHEAGSWSDSVKQELRALSQHPKAVAVGETGLDYYRNHASKADQMRAFQGQMELAAETQLPFVIHQRSASEDLLDALEASGMGASALLHCFSGSVEEGKRAAGLGCFFGLGGILTYPKSDELRQAVETLPSDRVMVETDSPWLAPQAWRGKRNEPSYVRAAAEAVASARGESFERAAQKTSEAARRFFRLEN